MVVSVIILCCLGTWQIHRLHWKEALLAQLDAAYKLDAAHTPITASQLSDAVRNNALALRGTLTGRYLHGDLRLTPRFYQGKPGFNIYTPLQLTDGVIVLVNRGWIPQDMTAIPPAAPGEVRVTGLLRKPDRGNAFTPPNDPAHNIWFRIDLAQIAQVLHLPQLMPYVLYTEATGAVAPGQYPKPAAERLELYNNHRSYAIFWFMMAGMMIGFYGLRFFSTYGRGSVIIGDASGVDGRVDAPSAPLSPGQPPTDES